MEILQSPNLNDRPSKTAISAVVIHYTGMRNSADALERLCDPVAKVSCHYLIDLDGSLYNLVAEEKRAWHAGVSHWAGKDNLNDTSIGIELQNKGHEYGYENFPELQINSLLELLAGIFSRHSIKPEFVLAHSDIAPDRRMDPGELFNWKLLADSGFSIWPTKDYSIKSGGRVIARPGDRNEYISTVQKKLQDCGYKISITGEFDTATTNVVTAFRRRFTPHLLHPAWDELTEVYLGDLLGLVYSEL